ncbi:AP endonuclease [Sistotremastrum niveocremeum HHB9708]|uniref:Apurinic-apyrimidinic endonuclease 1 n=1 Tax=Sistotremastrum niveocremeum HHB9708 TaxID=1314777 RepID=A0A164RZR1_9AGAM|nr:AP endonuclease [Sistotremastrum niveocremeum HHB9708]
MSSASIVSGAATIVRRSARNVVRVASTSAKVEVNQHEENSKSDIHKNESGRAKKKLKVSAESTTLANNTSQPEHIAYTTTVEETSTTKTRKKTARTKEIPLPSPCAYPPRPTNEWKIGAHISAAGGVENAILNASTVRANAFALFLKSQRKWTSPPLKEASIALFKDRMKEFGYESRHVIPHGSYLINLGNPDSDKRAKSYECFLDDLKRCEQLGLTLYNFHPGSTVGQCTTEESIKHVATCLNEAHRATHSVITVLENMAGAGNIIGSKLSELRDIIDLVEDKTRVGVCIDTCHVFAAGYDIRSEDGWEAMLQEFDEMIGLKYLLAMHINDSKTPLGSKKDRHENIGLGHIGIQAFKRIVTDRRTRDIPLILETPGFEKVDVWTKEIDVLNRISLSALRSQHPNEDDEKGEREQKGAVEGAPMEDEELNELDDVPLLRGGSEEEELGRSSVDMLRRSNVQ